MNLKEFLKEKGQNCHAWAKEHSFEPSTIWRIAEGKTKPSMDTAYKIVEATKGKVGYKDLT